MTAVVIFVLAYAMAYGETFTIAHFPYYTFKVQHVASFAFSSNQWVAIAQFLYLSKGKEFDHVSMRACKEQPVSHREANI